MKVQRRLWSVVAFLMATGGPVLGNTLTDNLTHRYSFTSSAVDSVAGADGVLQGGASISNGAVVLNGTNGYVALPQNLVTGYTAITLEAWVTDNGSAPWARIYDFGSNTTHYLFLSLPAGPGNLRGAYNSGGGEQFVEWVGGRPAVGQKAHIVWTSDSVSQVGALYVNGTRVGVNTNLTQTPNGVGQTTNDWLGRSQFAADPYFKGAIDEFRIYKAALSAAEVLTNYQAGPDALVADLSGVPGILHRWSFSETNGLNLQDSIGGATGRVVVLGAVDYALTNGGVRLTGGAKGTADYIELPAGLLHGLTDVTLEAWVTPRSFQIWSRLFDFGSGSGVTANTFFLALCRNASLNQQRYEFGSPAVFTVDTGLPTTVGQPHHYVATWNHTGGAGGSGRAQWYRDGALAGGIDVAAASLANVDDTVLWLGRSQYPDNTANADFTEFRMYNRALTAQEINFNRVNGPDQLVVPPPQAVDDAITLNPGAMALVSVLQNDQGTLLDSNSVSIANGPVAGTAQLRPGGRILYTHNGGPALADQFGYTVKDGLGRTSAVATVHVTITPALRLPNTTITIPNTPPPISYQAVDAFPGLIFTNALALRSPPGSSNQLFVVERRGIISFVPDITAANPVRQVFLNISDRIAFDNTPEGELGLLGMDFHPGFATNGIFFAYYTAPGGSPYFDRLSRFNSTGLVGDPNSEQILFNVVDEEFNHNGGDVHFGPDGYLYISMGDEGAQYNFHQNAQRIDKDFFSGILRIDVDKRPGNLEPTPHPAIPTDLLGNAFYSIPADNPFVGATSFFGQPINTSALRAEFYAVGLRHPWRFSFDSQTGELWAGDVGQDMYEEVDLIVKGGNYGWAYYEGTNLAPLLYPAQPTLLTNPPPGLLFPVWKYTHLYVNDGGDPQYKGNSISGGVVYHGAGAPDLAGAYIVADFEGANIWALRRSSNGPPSVIRVAGDLGIAAFGIDPSNGDVLMANYLQNKVKRLVHTDATGSTFPAKLSDTGVFADLATLTPNPGIVSYEPIVAFWSDNAIKRRWFTIPNPTNTIGFSNEIWSLPSGMMWIKHFDLELERGNPASKRRLETRVLVKNDAGSYGVSYKWDDAQADAFLVGDGGTNFFLTVQDGTNSIQQQWEIPSRSACLACHTPVAGHALSFKTRELNQAASLNGTVDNQIHALGQAGYFSGPVPDAATLPAFATATDTNYSREYRVRSYLAVNCIQCHQPGGAGPASWDARPFLTLEQTGLILGQPENNGGDASNKIITPGDTVHSVLLNRLQGTNGFGRMPPLATHLLDSGAIQLVAGWISQDLTNRLTYDQWRAQVFPGNTGPTTQPGADPDGDSANNFVEYLTRTDPQNGGSAWKLSVLPSNNIVMVSYPRVPNLGVVVEVSSNLLSWSAWPVAGNQPVFAATAGTATLSGPRSTTAGYFRARFVLP